MKLILGVVGEKLAGKDTVAKYIQQKTGAFHIKFSNLLDEILTILDMPISRRNEIDLGLGLRDIFGPEVLYKALKKRVLETDKDIAIVNGIRMDEQEKVIKELGAKIIYVTAPVEIRFERYKQRQEKTDDAVMNFEQFKEQENELTEVGIPELGKRADFKIENTGSLKELYTKVDDIIDKIDPPANA
jgi:dephospho-CoA kinase